MTETEFLEAFHNYLWLQAEMESVWEQLTRVRTEQCRVTVVLSDQPRSGSFTGSKTEKGAEQAEPLEELYVQLRKRMQETERLFHLLPSSRARLLLRLRFIDDLTLEQTAERMGLSYQWTSELQKRAIRAIAKKTSPSEKSEGQRSLF